MIPKPTSKLDTNPKFFTVPFTMESPLRVKNLNMYNRTTQLPLKMLLLSQWHIFYSVIKGVDLTLSHYRQNNNFYFFFQFIKIFSYPFNNDHGSKYFAPSGFLSHLYQLHIHRYNLKLRHYVQAFAILET